MCGAERLDLADQFGSVHFRHDHVHHRQIDFVAVGLADAQRFLAARRFQHVVAAPGEDVHNQLAHARLVFHQQDGFAAGQRHQAGRPSPPPGASAFSLARGR